MTELGCENDLPQMSHTLLFSVMWCSTIWFVRADCLGNISSQDAHFSSTPCFFNIEIYSNSWIHFLTNNEKIQTWCDSSPSASFISWTSEIPSPVCCSAIWWAVRSSLMAKVSLQVRQVSWGCPCRVRIWCAKCPEWRKDFPQYSQINRRFFGRPTLPFVFAFSALFLTLRLAGISPSLSSCKTPFPLEERH